MTHHTHIVAEYVQFDDATPFQPLQLQYVVNELVNTEPMHGELITVLRYKEGDKIFLLSFGLGNDVAMNFIIGLPVLYQQRGLFYFGDDSSASRSINARFIIK